ncbi:radical SAM protein [Thioalkalicoccus limnaeus]|uniref:Radical SAM protein n=1 Tax=Thioalkalicoccus limnaeus TaxID=120681 RepID=A0ABV4BE83_9GAMM
MKGRHISLVLLPTSRCNAACDYCFEDRTHDQLSQEGLQVIIGKLLDHMDGHSIEELTIHWQGGEALLLPPDWYRRAFAFIEDAAAARGKRVAHGLQTNLLAYGPTWDPIIFEMFGGTVSTSVDYPNRHRKVPGRGPEHYDALFARKLEMARAAGIDVKAIAVPNQATLAIGAARFCGHLVEVLGITDFQINTPFPGGAPNAVKRDLCLDLAELTRFHCELADVWLGGESADRVRIGPFDQLLDYFLHREARLPCIWGPNCADELICVDARGTVSQCDCWVTSYPEQHFGNIFDGDSLSDLLRGSRARERFLERPARLMQGECLECEYLALCHGGCPVRTYSLRGRLFEKDPYCELYAALFQHIAGWAARLSARAVRPDGPRP